jgi:hypothetical protein
MATKYNLFNAYRYGYSVGIIVDTSRTGTMRKDGLDPKIHLFKTQPRMMTGTACYCDCSCVKQFNFKSTFFSKDKSMDV